MPILLNADLGESWYDQQVGNDAGLMPYVDLCNLACGFHGGDALTMQRTIAMAQEHGVKIGAHPSFPDRSNFGRQVMKLPTEQLGALVLYQVAALQGMVRAVGAPPLYHLKPHGALYHYANSHAPAASVIVHAALKLGIAHLLGPPTGELRRAAVAKGLGFLAEGFADRRYEPTLHLRPRTQADACIDSVEEAVGQTLLLAKGWVRTTDGTNRKLQIETLCLHGDHAGAAQRARALREALGATLPR